MKKSFLIAKANISKYKSAVLSLFLIILAIGGLGAVGISIMLGVLEDYEAGVDRLNGLHSVFIMTKDVFKSEYEDMLKSDSRVTQYDIGEAIHLNRVTVDYGGLIEHQVIILNADAGLKISAPPILDRDETTPPESAVFLPVFARQNLALRQETSLR